ncbi:relaxase/mobilization nuclease domain-containing protein [Butyrivibrio sp. VCB2006]|uniref:relaxase/mobilization nuclease domain-containing protein n=1 Tax=Butyrivibrio sp. VCB2006 TaxID=1280679 RepID=UPI0003F9CDE4|nr:relaxase/mobilization nuclease domain-containing protein [Butyrivibrio sp. VCB2006]
MATTRLIPMHAHSGTSLTTSLGLRTDYAKNPDKTEEGKYISSYRCDQETVTEEFTFVRQIYDRDHGKIGAKSDVIAYQIRQAFAPGEISPEQANKLGYDLAMRFTKGNYQFIVATHTDKKHIHNHIIFNSVSMDSRKKFRNFWGSSFALRKVNDIICLENNLSVIKNPKHGNNTYGKWLGDHKKPSHRDYIRTAIDDALKEKPASFKALVELLKTKYNIDVDESGKHTKLKCEGQKTFARIGSLGAGYTREDIEKRIRGEAVPVIKGKDNQYEELAGRRIKTMIPDILSRDEKLSLLIDVQKKIQEGKGSGYERWAKQFNLKQTAKTLSFLSDMDVNSYDDLKSVHKKLFDTYESLRLKIKGMDERMEKIKELQGAIITYIQTNDSYQKYKKSGYSKKVKEELLKDIMDHEEARKHFKEYEGGKLPTIKELKAEYAELKVKKSELYKDYQKARRDYTEIAVARKNIDIILDRDHDGVHDFLEKDERERSK